jgi:hypothetical protein
MLDLKKLISLPYYTTKVPSTGKTVSFRPFVVKEEKMLLMAKQTENIEQISSTIKQVLSNCFKEELDFDEMPFFDIEYLFIQLRLKSMGEIVDIVVTDPKTKEKFDTVLKLENVKVINFDKNKNMTVNLNDVVGVELKYPPIKTIWERDNNKNFNPYSLLAHCIKTIYTKDEMVSTKDLNIEEIIEFIESLPTDMYSKLEEFFLSIPMVVYDDVFISPTTGTPIPVKIRNFDNFFR